MIQYKIKRSAHFYYNTIQNKLYSIDEYTKAFTPNYGLSYTLFTKVIQ